MSYGSNSFGVTSYAAPAGEVVPSESLTIQGALHSISSDNLTLSATGESSLTIQDSQHGHSSDNVLLSILPAVDLKIAILGDSNASGRGSFSQTNTATNAYLYDVSGNVVSLSDPWDAGTDTYSALSDSGSVGGSYVQKLASLIDATGKSTLWIPVNKGGTTSTSWAYSTNTTTCYGAMRARLIAAGGADVILIHLGANDAIGGMSQATFTANMNAIIGHLETDFPSAKIYLQKIHHNSSATTTNIDNIRAAVDDIWNGSTSCLPGADLEGITTNVHYGQTGNTTTCTSELNEVALRTFQAAFGSDLVINDSLHVHTAENLVLSTSDVSSLVVQDCTHNHSVDNIILTLTETSDLLLNDGYHTLLSDNIQLDTNSVLTVFDSVHSLISEEILLSSDSSLSLDIQYALHQHNAENVNLTTEYFLYFQNCMHAHIANNITLQTNAGGTISSSEVRDVIAVKARIKKVSL